MQNNNDSTARTIDEQAAQRRAGILGLSYFDTSKTNIELYKSLLDYETMSRYKLVPLYVDSTLIRIGITNTTSHAVMQQFRQRFQDQRIEFYMISDAGFKELMLRYNPPKKITYSDINISHTTDQAQIENVSLTLDSVKADDMLAYLVKQAYQLNASDIHIETDRNDVRIRIRVDGVLHPIAMLKHEKYRLLLSSIASAANIFTAATDPQNGHINHIYRLADGSSVEVNLRIETVPTIHGMDVVMRLFTLNEDLMRLDKLGLQTDEMHIIQSIISHPSGLVLIVGPTGSGKTTTLYSILNELNNPERKIITLEDPVEYNIKGVTQIPVDTSNSKQSFSETFRAVLRLDPDVLMVGEIRDHDTAKIALQSSLTGHLVLSTYHADSAAAALTRLLDAIKENPLFLSAIRVIQAQRLIRRLDDTTKEAYTPDEKTLQWLQKVINTLPERIEKPKIDNIQLYRPVPSPSSPFGYRGIVAVRELLLITPRIEEEFKKPVNEILTRSIQEAAINDGMTTMLHEAVLKILAGETSLEEVSRVLA